MPRTARASVGGICYHVINRGNGQAEVFHKNDDFAAFIQLMSAGKARLPMRVLAYCLMPNHFHLVLWPREDGDLSRWMQWLLTAHVRRYHQHHASRGHIWQGRFKAFPIQQDEHLLTVWRYVEANPVRAGLVRRGEDWTWSSLAEWCDGVRWRVADAGPVDRARNWLALVNRPLEDGVLAGLHQSVNRGAPWGEESWVRRIAARLGINSSLRPRGRPRKPKK